MAKYALLIGISTYKDEEIPPVAYAARDAHELGECLRATCGFDEVKVLSTDSDETSRAGIVDSLLELSEKVEPEDTFLFFFAGHGQACEGQSLLLVPETNSQGRILTSIKATDLRSAIKKVQCAQRIMIFDCCRTFPDSGRAGDDNLLDEDLVRDIGTQVKERREDAAGSNCTLWACGTGQRAYGMKKAKHGILTYYLLEALKGKAWDEDGLLTMREVVRYVIEEVPKEAKRAVGREQKPRFDTDATSAEEIVLVSNSPSALSPKKRDAAGTGSVHAEVSRERLRRERAEKEAAEAEERVTIAEEAQKEAEGRWEAAAEAQKRAESRWEAAEEARRKAVTENEKKIAAIESRAAGEARQAAKVEAQAAAQLAEKAGTEDDDLPGWGIALFLFAMSCLVIGFIVICSYVLFPVIGGVYSLFFSGGNDDPAATPVVKTTDGSDRPADHLRPSDHFWETLRIVYITDVPSQMPCGRHSGDEVLELLSEAVKKQYRAWGKKNKLWPRDSADDEWSRPSGFEPIFDGSFLHGGYHYRVRVGDLTGNAWSIFREEILADCPKCNVWALQRLEKKRLILGRKFRDFKPETDEDPFLAVPSPPAEAAEAVEPGIERIDKALEVPLPERANDAAPPAGSEGAAAAGSGAVVFIRGDVNGDGVVSDTDCAWFVDYHRIGRQGLVIPSGPRRGSHLLPCLDRYDVNDDGEVNPKDLTYLKNYLNLEGPGLPPPFPAEGEDPTPDDLPCNE